MSDRLRLIRFSEREISAIRGVLHNLWARGIQAERQYHGAHEFKLKGNPWNGQVRLIPVACVLELGSCGVIDSSFLPCRRGIRRFLRVG